MFLLESRLSPEQRAVLERVQELARSQEVNIYLTGGAVRDLISGQPIRDLDFTVEGNPGAHGARARKGRRARGFGKRAPAALRNDFRRRRGRLDFRGARRRVRAAGNEAGIPLFRNHGGPAAARFFGQRDRHFAEHAVARDCCSIPRTASPTSSGRRCARFRFTLSRTSRSG